MKLFTALMLVVTFFAAGANIFILFTSPYYLTLGEHIHLVLVTIIMLFSLVAFIAVVEPHKYVEQITSYLSLIIFLLFIISFDYLVEILYKFL